MMDVNKTYKLFDDYLNGNLSLDLKKSFEADLLKDNNLKEEFEAYKAANNLIFSGEVLKLKAELTSIHKKRVLRNKILYISLALLILLGLTIATLKLSQHDVKQNTKKAFTQNKETINFQDKTVDIKEVKPNKTVKSNDAPVNYFTTISNKNVLIPLDTVKTIANIKKDTNTLTLIKPNLIITEPLSVIQDSIRFDSLENKIPCNLAINLADVVVDNTCENKNTGMILFTNNSSNYLYTINNGANFYSSAKYSNLSAGEYKIAIKDVRTNCISNKISVEIEAIKCDYIIKPNQFIYWEKDLSDFSNDNEVELSIFNANTGNLVFKKNIPTTEDILWDGKTNLNESLPSGLYFYNIKSDKKNLNGTITIIN